MPYTTHGHWFGPGEPTQPGPALIAKCGGPGICAECRHDASAHTSADPDPLGGAVLDVDWNGPTGPRWVERSRG